MSERREGEYLSEHLADAVSLALVAEVRLVSVLRHSLLVVCCRPAHRVEYKYYLEESEGSSDIIHLFAGSQLEKFTIQKLTLPQYFYIITDQQTQGLLKSLLSFFMGFPIKIKQNFV